MKHAALLLVASLLLMAPSCSQTSDAGLPIVKLKIDRHTIRAELAKSPAEQSRGLMYRREMAKNDGMLFIYETPLVMSFWMKNTFIPLDIAFLKDDGTIVNIEQMAPQTTAPHKSSEPVRYALEMNQGWFEAHGIKPGDRFETKLP